MASTRSILPTWRHLHDAASRLKTLAPWEWMTESDVFGVEHPETGDLGFVSVMGMLGEHHAVTVYLGPEALAQFWALQQAGPSADPERVLEIPQLQASFEDRDMLQKQDQALIKQLGLKFRGRQAWPLFRSFRPGFVPWFLEPGEVQFLSSILDQVSEVAERLQDNAALLPAPDEGGLFDPGVPASGASPGMGRSHPTDTDARAEADPHRGGCRDANRSQALAPAASHPGSRSVYGTEWGSGKRRPAFLPLHLIDRGSS